MPFSITGTLGAAGAGATVKLTGTSTATTTAAADTGDYSFTGLADGVYLVTPGLAGAGFSPTSAPVTIDGADVSGLDFTVFTPKHSDGFIATGSKFTPELESLLAAYTATNSGIKISS